MVTLEMPWHISWRICRATFNAEEDPEKGMNPHPQAIEEVTGCEVGFFSVQVDT
jgi:hypothetical protein